MPLTTTTEKLKRTLAIIMGGGRGTRLAPLTNQRSKPAVPLGGKYRLVDIPISNCLNSNIGDIFVLTQFNSESLNRHVHDAYKFDSFRRDFVRILAAQQTTGGGEWYQGTADAVRQNLSYFLEQPYEHFLILSGDQLYRMDFRKMLASHLVHDAHVTIATKPVEREAAKGFGLMDTDENGRITRFQEKPKEDAILDSLSMSDTLKTESGINPKEDRYLASMGIYLFNRSVLEQCLDNDLVDFGGDIIPQAIKSHRVFSYIFDGYWEDIGTIKSFYEANLALTQVVPNYNFFDSDNPIYTRARFLPASKINSATIEEALISDGCIISRATIRRSLIGVRSVIESGAEITDSVIMGADYYDRVRCDETGCQLAERIRIGEGTRIHRAIVDKNAIIGRNVVIDPGDRVNEDVPFACIRDGIVVVPKSTVIPDNVVV